ncbi:MAG TPA: hypothetical protein VG713_15665 [Pirellulales bacterium]|nr:hypothetical protein [Pirellulales bacterium]
MLVLARRFALLLIVMSAANACLAVDGRAPYPTQHPEYKPGGCYHYGWKYNPHADYGPYWTGHPRPVMKAAVRIFCGVPYPGYFHGPVPGTGFGR